MSRIQMGERQNSPTSGRGAKWSISYILYSQKISELLAKFHSQKVVVPSPRTSVWRTRGLEESDFDLTALSCISGSTRVTSFPLCYKPSCHPLVWRSRFAQRKEFFLLFPDIHKSQPFQEQTLLRKGVEKRLLIATEESHRAPRERRG